MGVAAVAALSSCGEKDLYNPDYAKELQEAKYAENFEKKFGTVPSTYSWDASTGEPFWVTRADERVAINDSDIKKDGSYYGVTASTLNWLNENLVEGKDNRSKGKAFAMTVPSNEFTVVPIYQGHASYKWTLHIAVGNKTKQIWSKSEGIQTRTVKYTRTSTSGSWTLSSEGDWNTLSTSGNTMESVKYYKKSGDVKTCNEGEATIKEVTNGRVQAKPITIDLSRYAGQMMYFYLYVDNTRKNESSLDGQMLAMDTCPVPDNLPEGSKTIIMGCEDAHHDAGSDHDMNDIVFMIYGKPYVPGIIDITDDEIEEVNIAKRYMFEDLGSTDDIDFNDVVVDMKDITKYKLTYTNGILTDKKVVKHYQTAEVKWLGGTIPVEVFAGNTSVWKGGSNATFDKAPDPAVVVELPEGTWVPASNNMKLVSNYGENTFEIVFPADGHPAPYVIATDITVPWMAERESITKEWFDGLKE
ncbi:MAG: hypothetical protein HUJ99_03110 [Bacteroidaceae bacterium]|nr:hypothetical protein [Bacteroidaceae bacterium]